MNKPHGPHHTTTPIYASVKARLAAYAVDCALLFSGLLVWQAALYVVNPVVAVMRQGQQPTGGQLHRWVFATATLPFLAYFAVTQSSAHQATVGMRMLKLKVATEDGTRITFKQAVLRCTVMLVPFELNHTVLFHLMSRDGQPSRAFALGYIGVWTVIGAYIGAIPFTRRRQSVHDLLAGTVVLREQ